MKKVKIDKLIRSSRRSIALMVSVGAQLIVKAPYHTPLAYIEKILRDKAVWIENKINEIKALPKALPKQFIDSEKFLFLGENYLLKINDDKKIAILRNELFFPQRFLLRPKFFLERWYRSQAQKTFSERAAYYAKTLGVEFRSLKLSNARGCWGSCGAKKT